jgi:hypothetical protein
MPPNFGRKPKPKLIINIRAAPNEDVIAERRQMFDGWIDECVGIQEAFIEGLLTLMPSLSDDPTSL